MTEPIKLEAGKAYRTRGGERVEIEDNGGNKTFNYRGVVDGVNLTFRENGKHCHQEECPNDLIGEWIEEPEIDWGGSLQISDPDEPENGWDDLTVVWRCDDYVIGWVTSDGPIHVNQWKFTEWQFRNKPPEPSEPKRIKGWINIYDLLSNKESFRCAMYATKELADWAAASYRIACVYIDIPYGHSLEGNPDGP